MIRHAEKQKGIVNITGFQLENKNQRFSLEAKEKIKMNSG
jgi:hypothetical protein